MLRLSISLLVTALVLTGSACAGLTDPVTAANIQGCIKKNCDEHEATAYQACEASCRQRYGR